MPVLRREATSAPDFPPGFADDTPLRSESPRVWMIVAMLGIPLAVTVTLLIARGSNNSSGILPTAPQAAATSPASNRAVMDDRRRLAYEYSNPHTGEKITVTGNVDVHAEVPESAFMALAQDHDMEVNSSPTHAVETTSYGDGYGIATVSPSFDCNKSTHADEVVICHNNDLAQLDNLVATGYGYLVQTRGVKTAKPIGLALWRSREACGADAACIRERQLVAIRTYQDYGVPIDLPTWAGW